MERERAEKLSGAGPKRQKGRPRKFPGYLVREMRLKKNRAEYRELLRSYTDGGEPMPLPPLGDPHRSAGDDGDDGDGQEMGDGGGFWPGDMEQSILAAVEGLEDPGHADAHMRDAGADMSVGGVDMGQHGDGHGHGHDEEVPSSRAFEGGGGEMEMRRVFELPAEAEQDDDAR